MSLLNLKPRPIKRGDGAYRDDRLFLVACDDTYAPDQYFSFFEIPRIHVKVIPPENDKSHAQHVLTNLLSYKKDDFEEFDERWMLLDTDHCIKPGHVKKFREALKKAKQENVKVALSRSCFEVWLLLHHCDENEVKTLGDAAEVELTLRAKLGEYNKVNLKREHFPPNLVIEACRRAEALDNSVTGGMIPNSTTSRVYLLWKAIVSKAFKDVLIN